MIFLQLFFYTFLPNRCCPLPHSTSSLPQTRGVLGYISLSNTTSSQGYIGIGRWDEGGLEVFRGCLR